MPWPLAFILGIFLPLIGVNLYVGRRLLDAFTERFGWNRSKVKKALWTVQSFINLLPVFFFSAYLIYGRAASSAFSGEVFLIDLLLTYPFWIGLVFVVQLFLLLLIFEIVKLILLPLYWRYRQMWQRRETHVTLWTAGLTAVYVLLTIVINTWTVRVDEHDIPIPPEMAGLDGVRIALISDIQADARTGINTVTRFVERVNALRPDVIFSAGDVVTSGRKYIGMATELLSQLKAPYGVYAVVGDHDIFSDKQMVVDRLRRGGIIVAEDTTLTIKFREKETVDVTFVTYTYRQRPDFELLKRQNNHTNASFKILLVHQPAEQLVDLAKAGGYHLVLAGHTHGGGIAFGIPGCFMVAPASFESRYLSGLYKAGQTYVAVTNGLGFTLAPIRYHAPAEITLLTLTVQR
jgi:predicted MPP superfamily phosphohydrolase